MYIQGINAEIIRCQIQHCKDLHARKKKIKYYQPTHMTVHVHVQTQIQCTFLICCEQNVKVHVHDHTN